MPRKIRGFAVNLGLDEDCRGDAVPTAFAWRFWLPSLLAFPPAQTHGNEFRRAVQSMIALARFRRSQQPSNVGIARQMLHEQHAIEG
jgi:hypothetical protein